MNLQRGSTARRLLAIAIVIGIFAYRWLGEDAPDSQRVPAGAPTASATESRAGSGTQAIVEAFAQERSGVWVETSGRIERHLADDTHGSRHQRFIVRLTPDHTVLVSHNIDLAERTAAAAGDEIAFRGRYEWNDRGGVVHWTHHDPQRGIGDYSRGGWLRAAGVTVR